MPAITAAKGLRQLPPLVEPRLIQNSARNIQIMNDLLQTELTATIATAGLGSVVDITA